MRDTTNITLTEPQIKALRELNGTDFQFPANGRTRSCEKLEEYGLADSEHRMFKQVYQGGERSTEFRRAYRLTALGLKLQPA
jgi:hypothetical protein